MEIELKLQLSGADADAVLNAEIFGGNPTSEHQHSVYFDTSDAALADAGLTLRIRNSGDRTVQTVKAGAQGAGVFARAEWEKLIDGRAPVLDATTPVPTVLGARALAPAFSVDVLRRTWVHDGVELVLDRGEIAAGARRTPICELELELKGGTRAALFAMARQIEDVAPLRIGVQAKSERGYLLTRAMPRKFKAGKVALSKDMTAAEAFAQIVQSCLRQFRLNEDLLIAHREAAQVHQARVALRRMRSAFSVFRPMLGADAGAGLRSELRWLASELGPARDLDVLLTRAEPGPLRERLLAAREEAYDRMLTSLASRRARGLMLDLVEWLEIGAWRDDPDLAAMREKPARVFAASALTRFRGKVAKGGRNMAALDDPARHEVRKDAKKLRYASDFFAPIVGSKKRFTAALADLQEQLGALNDLATAPGLLVDLGIARDPGAEALLSHGRRKPLLAAAVAAHGDLVAADRYWR